jgi:hypothetical protein
MNSDTPRLRGGFPLTPSLTLRLLMLKEAGEEDVVRRMLSQSLFGRSSSVRTNIIEHFHSFSNVLLRNLNVLDDGGKAVWLAPLVCHLSWADPFNLLLVYFLDRDILKPIFQKEGEDGLEQLLQAFSCIMQPVPVHPKHVANVGSSKVVDAVPELVQQGIRDFNKEIILLYLEFASKMNPMEFTVLPLSKRQVGPSKSHGSSDGFSSFSKLRKEHVLTVDQLVFNVRFDLCVDHGTVPAVPVLQTYNCFLVDFFRQDTPNTSAIERDNQIQGVWFLIQNASFMLRMIAVALTKLELKDGLRVIDANLFRFLQLKNDVLTKPDAADAGMALAFFKLALEFNKKFNSTKK